MLFPRLPMRFCFVFLAAPLLLLGCTTQKALIAEQATMIDSLYVIERTLRADLYATQDSIRFYDDINSGQYYRDRRSLLDRIDHLEYLVAVRRDSLCLPEVPEAVDTLLVDNLFKPASAELTEEGMLQLDALAAHLDSLYAGRLFRIEAHADNVPPGAALQEQYPSNWELSAARATRVVRHLAQRGLEPDRFEAVSYGDTQPVAPNRTAAGRRLNRRIAVFVLPDV